MDLEELAQLRIPRYSWDYEHLPEPDHWFLLARAYLECTCHLFMEMVNERVGDSFHHAKVAMSLFEHAVELFLKGAIVQAGRTVPAHHRAADLLALYRSLYGGAEFEFKGKIDEAVSDSQMSPRAQYARYPHDKKGAFWPGHTHIDLAIWCRETIPFKEDFERLVPLFKKRYPLEEK